MQEHDTTTLANTPNIDSTEGTEAAVLLQAKTADTLTGRAYLQDLEAEMDWLQAVMAARAGAETSKDITEWRKALGEMPELSESSQYGHFCRQNNLAVHERLALALALAPYLKQGAFEEMDLGNNAGGLLRCPATLDLVPSGKTLFFVLTEPQAIRVPSLMELFGAEHLFQQKAVLHLGEPEANFPAYTGALVLNPPYRELFLTNEAINPRYSAEFPAKKLTTGLEWDDLLLPERTRNQLQEIIDFQQFEKELRKDAVLGKHLKPGYRAIFAGPSGVGKTLTAGLIGKRLGLPVYRVDLSQLVSKYIGETSKNLDKLFNLAEDQGWILFFDEGDALFGKRVDTGENDQKNAHYANQEIAYLLQRIEDYNGLVFVATNKPQNMDSAFGRRFQAKVSYEPLDDAARLEQWRTLLTRELTLGPDVSLESLNKLHRFSMANIYSVVARVTVLCKAKNTTVIDYTTLRSCALDEKMK